MYKHTIKYARKIVVFLHYGIGDVIMCSSFLKALTNHHPKAKIYCYVKSDVEKELIECYDLGENVIPIPLNKLNFLSFFIQNFFRGNDLFFAAHSVDHIKYWMLKTAVNAKLNIGPKGEYGSKIYEFQISNEDKLHRVKYTERFLEVFLKAKVEFEGIRFPDSIYNKSPLYENHIVIAPGSGEVEKHKRWPIENYVQLINRLQNEYDYTIVLFGSERERSLVTEIYNGVENSIGCKIVIAESMRHSINVIRNAKAVISACTGSSHIAAACEAPILTFFGPTNQGFTGPYTDKIVPLSMNLACSPCYKSSMIKGCGDAQCMKTISVDLALGAFSDLMQKKYGKLTWYDLKYIDKPTYYNS